MQDRPIVSMENCYEVGITDSLAAFRSSSRRSPADQEPGGFKYKICTH